MDVTITPGPLSGTVPAIASKSVAHRLLILSALSPEVTDIDCNATSEDIEATIGCLEGLGARVARTRLGFRVKPIDRSPDPDGRPRENARAILDCGESGSTLRFMLPVAAALGRDVEFTGRGRLAKRPLSPLYERLEEHGVTLSDQGSFPLAVTGRLSPGRFTLPGTISSQFATGLLLAAPLLPSPVQVVVTEPVESRSYIAITLRALAEFGVGVDTSREALPHEAATVYTVSPAGGLRSPGTVSVEGDWSNSAFWLASGALGPGVGVTGLDAASAQGDRAILACLAAFGARVMRGSRLIEVSPDRLSARRIDVSDIPDLVPPIAAVAAFSDGVTRIESAGRLRLKESDRLESVRAALVAMGGDVSIEGDSLVIVGGTLRGGEVDAANDHRIAMMAAIAAARAQGPTVIRGAECVRKSYPRFFEDFRSLGGRAEEH